MVDHPAKVIVNQDKFDDREVGLTHPDNGGFVRICNNGDIEFSSGEGVFVLNGRSRTLTLSTTTRLLTRHDRGLRWNSISFNDAATIFNEPTFLLFDGKDALGFYRGVGYFTEGD